jgi:hypothetical protein
MKLSNKYTHQLFVLGMFVTSTLLIGCNSNTSQLAVNTISDTAKIIDDYDTAFIGIPLPDTAMQHNKEAFVIYGCAYCHGLYLTPVGEAADLRKSTIVAADVNGNLIGKILRNGIPLTAKSSPMPQYSDLNDEDIQAISEYIHYAREEANKASGDSIGVKK